jgi:hypothetical protein
VQIRFRGVVWYWRGPAPFHFVTVPPEHALEIAEISAAITYGWGMIPATVTIGGTEWTTSLWPKDGGYIVPLKTAVRRAEDVEVDDEADVRLVIAE